MCPAPGDDEKRSVIPGHWPSRHSGPGYAANPKAPDFELDEPLRGAAARWLNLVSAEHRRNSRESAADALETLREHTRSCPDHPLGALWVAHRHLTDPVPAVRATADEQMRVHDIETGGSSGEPLDVALLPDKARVERGVDPDRRWHLAGPSTGGGDSNSQLGGLGGDFAAGARSRGSFGTRFVLYQRNIENLCQDRTALREEIKKSVAELFDAALESRAAIAVKGAPEQHAEGADVPGNEDGLWPGAASA